MISIEKWAGLVTNASPYAIPPGAAVEQVNLQCIVPGQISVRPGAAPVSLVGESGTGTSSPIVRAFRYPGSSDRIVYQDATGKLFSSVTGVSADVSTGASIGGAASAFHAFSNCGVPVAKFQNVTLPSGTGSAESVLQEATRPTVLPVTIGPELVTNGALAPSPSSPWPNYDGFQPPTLGDVPEFQLIGRQLPNDPSQNIVFRPVGWSSTGADVQLFKFENAESVSGTSTMWFAHLGRADAACPAVDYTLPVSQWPCDCPSIFEYYGSGPMRGQWPPLGLSGALWQYIPTVPGKSYLVRFKACGRWEQPRSLEADQTRQGWVDAGGKQLFVERPTSERPPITETNTTGGWLFGASGSRFSVADMGWSEEAFIFTASETRTLLRFMGSSYRAIFGMFSTQSWFYGICVTDISVKEIAAT